MSRFAGIAEIAEMSMLKLLKLLKCQLVIQNSHSDLCWHCLVPLTNYLEEFNAFWSARTKQKRDLRKSFKHFETN
jgi:hypothetical protein